MVIYTDLTEKEIANFGELFNLGPVKDLCLSFWIELFHKIFTRFTEA